MKAAVVAASAALALVTPAAASAATFQINAQFTYTNGGSDIYSASALVTADETVVPGTFSLNGASGLVTTDYGNSWKISEVASGSTFTLNSAGVVTAADFGFASENGVYVVRGGGGNGFTGFFTEVGGPVDSLSITPVASAVPEPFAWAMMIAGFGVVGGAMRRRQRVATRVRFA